ncbi:hypothetical protein [Maridesulfovibrio bastinii]|uniref:hypothetical protein n=1 Tax=Maridesulfovibrio bastinii TaxID=47157 RepID=UPI0004884357|nr:hypothetical protein [Maridesulfovibrio bastinii]
MARQDLSPSQAISFLHDSCCALQTIQTLPEDEISAGAKVLLELIQKAVCSCAVVLDDSLKIKDGGEA